MLDVNITIGGLELTIPRHLSANICNIENVTFVSFVYKSLDVAGKNIYNVEMFMNRRGNWYIILTLYYYLTLAE